MKVTPHFQSCILQINARGISVRRGDTLKLHAFYEKDSAYIAKSIYDITCGDKTIYSRLAVNETFYPDGRKLEDICGFLLSINGLYYAALSDYTSFDTSRIKMWEESAPAMSEESLELSNPMPAEEPLPGAEHTETGEAIQEDDSNAAIRPMSEEDSDAAIRPMQKAIITENTLSEQETKFTEDAPFDPEYTLEPGADAAEADLKEQPKIIYKPNLTLSNGQKHGEMVRKIQHCDLSILPHKCWNLANNSFLMHGYHNYHHLLLVEEGGHYWLGVPGVYAVREARAAELFGFPQFTQTYTSQLELGEDEHNNNEKFGYWCRYIR